MFLIDAHLHLNEDCSGRYSDLDSIDIAMTCTAQHSEWTTEPRPIVGRTIRSFGIHPWYCGQWNHTVSDELRAILSEDREAHVGEIGLDAKHGTLDEQIAPFAEQMGICSEFGRIASVHMVGACENHILNIIKGNRGCRGIILHSFKGPESYIKPFAENGCMFSISPRIMAMSEERRMRLLSAIPPDRLLIETDYPHAGRGFESLGGFIAEMANGMDCDAESLSSTIHDNFVRMLE